MSSTDTETVFERVSGIIDAEINAAGLGEYNLQKYVEEKLVLSNQEFLEYLAFLSTETIRKVAKENDIEALTAAGIDPVELAKTLIASIMGAFFVGHYLGRQA